LLVRKRLRLLRRTQVGLARLAHQLSLISGKPEISAAPRNDARCAYRLPLNSEPKNSTPNAAPRIPNVNIPNAPPDVVFAVSLRGEFQGRVNRWGETETALAEREPEW
jgi:hypothetical protein